MHGGAILAARGALAIYARRMFRVLSSTTDVAAASDWVFVPRNDGVGPEELPQAAPGF